MNLFELFAKVSLDTSEYDAGVEGVAKSGESLGSKLKSGLSTAGSVAAKGIGLITTAATAAAGAFLSLESATAEYRVAQGKLLTAYETAGLSASDAQYAYSELYSVLGDTDRATEASQLLAQLATNGEDIAYWSHIAAGVMGTFGDSLPIEGLIEASNETAKVGQVTGVLADALNWVGISEDAFNEQLAACSDEAERGNLIMETLIDTYDAAADGFWENNAALVEARQNQALMDETLAKLGTTVSTVKNKLISEFVPSISKVVDAFNNLLNGVEGADKEISSALGELVDAAVNKLPEFLNMGVQILTSITSGIIQALPALVAALPQIISSISEALVDLGKQLLSTGADLLNSLTTGIETGLPDMVSRLPQIITEFVNFITENLPTVLDRGTDMLLSLMHGILEAIPEFVNGLPQIITAFVSFITESLPNIVSAGAEILTSLVLGIIQNIPELVAALPQIISAIVTGIKNLLGSIVDVGKAIVEGIWQGITNAAGWLTSKITGWFNGVVDGVKSFLGIASPSKVFADIGGNMALGLGEGWGDEFGRIKRDIEGGLDFGTARVDWASSGMAQSQRGLSSALQSVAASVGENINIVVQSVLDGKVIGETAYQYSRNKARAYGV